MEPDSATAERKRKASGASGIRNDDSNDGNSSRQGQALNMDRHTVMGLCLHIPRK